ncbi:MAG: hypothetical protein HC834_02345, partial [Rhodospirillales bacterium]|nr:hypothetical protein [Rhodospirillales bacterium]
YHPYGTSAYRAVDSSIDVSPKWYRYTGMERDEETSLEYHSARYYAPWLGRWTEVIRYSYMGESIVLATSAIARFVAVSPTATMGRPHD